MKTTKTTAEKTAVKKTAASEPKVTTSAKVIKPKADAAKSLRDLFEDELKDIYWAENALVKALPVMSANATSPDLKKALDAHLAVTKTQVTRLQSVFKSIGVKAEGKKCEAMAGLIKESEGIMEETQPGNVRDAGIISAGQKIEHYEIASYGTICTFARTLGEKEAAELLAQTLNEEKEADSQLSGIAEASVNDGAKRHKGKNE